jgi:hypothetical protein
MASEQLVFEQSQAVIGSPEIEEGLLLRRVESPSDIAGMGECRCHSTIIPVQTSIVQTKIALRIPAPC